MAQATAARVDLVIDFSAYADRIGVDSDATLAEVHRAHVFAIPFENLDPHRGVPVSLEAEDVERKLVAEQRGGYCFEQNLLLASALRELGHEVEPMLARVRAGAPPGTLRPRSHLVLRVEDGTDAWLADVGFGLGTPIEPIPFAVGVEVEQLGWRFRLVEDDREIVLQSCDGGAWADVYGFVPEPVPQVDIETSNWFTSTSPRSPFVTGLVAAAQRTDGTRTSLSDWGELALTVRTPTSTEVTPVERDAVPALLAEQFALPGFVLRDDGRVVPSA
jgi:N-hydroxyarylamine O-acetyltransferase